MSEDLTLEKLKISERLTTLEATHSHLAKQVDEIHHALCGYEGSCGLVKSVDRLEQTVTGWKTSIMLVWASIAGLVVKAFWSLFDK
jgi:hypothetical protein